MEDDKAAGFFSDEFLETSCLAREECVQELIGDTPANSLYRALAELVDEED